MVEANQSRACLSVSERARRDMPVSVGALLWEKLLVWVEYSSDKVRIVKRDREK